MIKDLPLLGAVIDETLRMHPPAPAGFPRRVPPDGIRLEDGVFIPPEMTVSCPTWTIQNGEINQFLFSTFILHFIPSTSMTDLFVQIREISPTHLHGIHTVG